MVAHVCLASLLLACDQLIQPKAHPAETQAPMSYLRAVK